MRRKLYYGNLIRLIIESFVIGMICSLISMKVILSRDGHQPNEERDLWTQANEIIAYIATSVFILFPILGTVFLHRRFDQLQETHFYLSFGELMQGYNIQHRSVIVLWVLGFLRT